MSQIKPKNHVAQAYRKAYATIPSRDTEEIASRVLESRWQDNPTRDPGVEILREQRIWLEPDLVQTRSFLEAEREICAAICSEVEPPSKPTSLTDLLSALDSKDASRINNRLVRVRAYVETHQKLLAQCELPNDLDDPFFRALAQRLDFGGGTGAVPHVGMAQLLIEVFASAADANGRLTAASVEETFGTTGLGFFLELTALDCMQAPEAIVRNVRLDLYEGLSLETVRKVTASTRMIAPLERMDGLAEFAKTVAHHGALNRFEQVVLFGHMLPTNVSLDELIERSGVPLEATTRVGKAKSFNADYGAHMMARGRPVFFNIESLSLANQVQTEGELVASARTRLHAMLHGVPVPVPGERSRFLLIDDGGSLAVALHRYFPQYAPLFRIVEQTESGIFRLKKELARQGLEKPLCAVINVAQSPGKKLYDSPAIAESIAFHIDEGLEEMSTSLSLSGPVGLLGNGAIGEALIAAYRRRNLDVFSFDPDETRLAMARAAGAVPRGISDPSAIREHLLRNSELILPCAPVACLQTSEYDLFRNGAILASGGPARKTLGLDFESHDSFARVDAGGWSADKLGRVRQTFRGIELDLGLQLDSLSHRIIRTHGGNELLLFRSGHTTNFKRGLPPEFAQLVLGFLWIAALQAVDEDEPDFIPLSDLQFRLIEFWLADLESKQLSATEPRFADVPKWWT